MSANSIVLASIQASSGFQKQTVYLGSGAQTLKWDYTYLSTEFPTPRGYLDEVSFTPGETAPIIDTQPRSQSQVPGMNALFSVTAVGTPPLGYQWRFNGTNISGAASASFTVTNVQSENLGYYSVVVTNSAGTNVSSDAALEFGEATAWGDSFYGATSVALGATNLMAVAAGPYYGLALRSDGQVLAWGINNYGQQNIPPTLTNAIAIAAGFDFALALRSDGTVAAWGTNFSGQTDVPADLTNVVAIAAGGDHGLALKSDGTVVGWGANFWGQTNVPAELSNVVAIAAGGSLSLALKSDGRVVAWGVDTLTNIPSSLSNVVAITTSGDRGHALKIDGTVAVWPVSQPTVLSTPPASWTNLVKIAAGYQHNVGLRADGAVVTMGFNYVGQTNVPVGLSNVISIGAGASYSLAQVGSGPPVTSAPISDLVLSNSGLSMTIPTQSGYVYRLEYKESLTDIDWIALPLVAGTGTNLVLTDPSAANSQRFYRVRRW